MKKVYEPPSVQIISFLASDIITSSGDIDDIADYLPEWG